MASFVILWFVWFIRFPIKGLKNPFYLEVVKISSQSYIWGFCSMVLLKGFCPHCSSSSSSSLCCKRGEGAGLHMSYMMFVSVAREWICGKRVILYFLYSFVYDFKKIIMKISQIFLFMLLIYHLVLISLINKRSPSLFQKSHLTFLA